MWAVVAQKRVVGRIPDGGSPAHHASMTTAQASSAPPRKLPRLQGALLPAPCSSWLRLAIFSASCRTSAPSRLGPAIIMIQAPPWRTTGSSWCSQMYMIRPVGRAGLPHPRLGGCRANLAPVSAAPLALAEQSAVDAAAGYRRTICTCVGPQGIRLMSKNAHVIGS